MSNRTLDAALTDVIHERGRQDAKWGPNRDHDPVVWTGMLAEEVGEAAREALNVSQLPGCCNQPDCFPALHAELVQVAAVAVAAIECPDQHYARHLQAQLRKLTVE